MLEIAIQFGKPFLFENVSEELDPVINPVLEKNFVNNNGTKAIVLGENMIDWNDNFRYVVISLYICVNLSLIGSITNH